MKSQIIVQIHCIGVFFVAKYRGILRLHAQGLSQRGIDSSCSNSMNTISNVLMNKLTKKSHRVNG